jgi:hypothetical protein
MAETKFTPGPWKAVYGEGKIGCDVRASNGRAVAATFGVCTSQPRTKVGYDKQTVESRANADFIAAAPDGYALIKRAVDDRIDDEWLDRAKEYLAHADGKQ